MDIGRDLFEAGVVLLSAAALVGFVQYRERDRPESFARWRVVHTGGTSGAVQLIALAVAFGHFGVRGAFASAAGVGVALATVAFFLGPLARAVGFLRTASLFNAIGAAIAVPAYMTLPFLLFFASVGAQDNEDARGHTSQAEKRSRAGSERRSTQCGSASARNVPLEPGCGY